MANWELRLGASGIVMVSIALYNCISICMGSAEHYVLSALASLILCLLGLIALHASSLKPAPSHSLSSLVLTYVICCRLYPVLSRNAHKRSLESMKHPQKFQDEVLMKILMENSQTALGKDHRLSNIQSRQEFVKTFPFTKYDFYEKYVERIANGETNVMTKAKVICLCASSGTTGKKKLYPMTNADLNLFQDFGLTLIHMISKMFTWKLNRELDFRMFHPETKTIGGVTITGVANIRKDGKPCRTSPPALPKISKEGPSYFVQALFGLRESHVDYIQGNSSDLMFTFFKSMEFNKDALHKAIAGGHIDSFPELEDDVRQELNKLLAPDPERASKVLQELEKGSHGFASRVWPRLKVVFMGRTGGYEHSAKLLADTYLKNITALYGVHGATEGMCGCSMTSEDLLREVYTFFPRNLFFEFIKVEEMHQSQPRTHLLSELEVGQLYEVVVTNWYGLYRNRLGDVIKVVGFTHNTPKYTFQYRTGQILNCAYDRTPEKVFYEALTAAETEWKAKIVNYTCSESINLEAANGTKSRKNHYVVFIETMKDEVLTDFHSGVLDEKLCEHHETYADFRKQDSVGPICIIQVGQGTFNSLRSLLWGNRPNVRYKTPRVLRNPQALLHLWNNRVR